jgi:flagellar biosynthesis/type III secretory pathway protein FliH
VSPPRVRIVRADAAATVAPLLAPGPSPALHRRIAREEMEARLAAERVEQDARARADAIVADAHARAVPLAEEARAAAREEAQAQGAAQWLLLRQKEGARIDASEPRAIELAVILAERLLGTALELEPARIASLAHGVLAEARGARRATIDAHPVDAAALREHLQTAGLDPRSVDVRDDPALARGALRLHTDVGIIDAQLAPRLERLAAALRDALS